MENFIKGLIYAHKEELSKLSNYTPGERERKQNLITRIDELEAILECSEIPKLRIKESLDIFKIGGLK